MIFRSTQLPTLFPSYDERASQPITLIDVPTVDLLAGKDFKGHGKGGTNYWVNEDRRPTKDEAREKIDDFNLGMDILDELFPEEVSNNIPYWIRGPFGWGPKLAQVLIEVDPLDRIQD